MQGLERRGRLTAMTMIADRPAEVEDRVQVGVGAVLSGFGLLLRDGRFLGLTFIGGLGMTALTANNIVVVPIRSGVGLRLGANIGYLKFTPEATWNPF